MPRLSYTQTGIVLLIGMTGTILVVLGFQHIGGYIPCKLCLEQREPYYAAIPVTLLVVVAAGAGWSPNLTRTLFAIIGLLLLYTCALAVFHAGVEWQWWQGPADCGATAGNISSDVGDLLSDLADKKPPSCDEAAGRFLGLSFAGWNVIASFLMAILAFSAALRKPE